LYSFQRDNDLRELPDNIVDLQHLLISWEDTLAALSNMDLVITSCTSIAHASAAMGKETWVVVPILPYHVWAYGAPESIHSPWYPETTRIFRQSKFGSWKEPFIEIEKELKLKYNLE
jgi:ADP-heptose:LPS heptosyltransferase